MDQSRVKNVVLRAKVVVAILSLSDMKTIVAADLTESILHVTAATTMNDGN